MKLLSYLKAKKDNLYLPKNYRIEDIFLVSYPKSGNTWLRFLIANAIKFHYEIDREVNFFTIQEIIPGLKGAKYFSPNGPFGRQDLARIIKSHYSYNSHYQRVILLARDPRDVMISYFHYLNSFNYSNNDQTIAQFIKNKKYGIKAWYAHTNSWVKSKNKRGQIIKLIRYEDLLENPEKELSSIMDLLGIPIENQAIKQAVSSSSKEKMRESERKHLSRFRQDNQHRSDSQFVRNASSVKGRELVEQDRKYIEEYTQDLANILGYEF